MVGSPSSEFDDCLDAAREETDRLLPTYRNWIAGVSKGTSCFAPGCTFTVNRNNNPGQSLAALHAQTCISKRAAAVFGAEQQKRLAGKKVECPWVGCKRDKVDVEKLGSHMEEHVASGAWTTCRVSDPNMCNFP